MFPGYTSHVFCMFFPTWFTTVVILPHNRRFFQFIKYLLNAYYTEAPFPNISYAVVTRKKKNLSSKQET